MNARTPRAGAQQACRYLHARTARMIVTATTREKGCRANPPPASRDRRHR